jgi:hypothetical protein
MKTVFHVVLMGFKSKGRNGQNMKHAWIILETDTVLDEEPKRKRPRETARTREYIKVTTHGGLYDSLDRGTLSKVVKSPVIFQ